MAVKELVVINSRFVQSGSPHWQLINLKLEKNEAFNLKRIRLAVGVDEAWSWPNVDGHLSAKVFKLMKPDFHDWYANEHPRQTLVRAALNQHIATSGMSHSGGLVVDQVFDTGMLIYNDWLGLEIFSTQIGSSGHTVYYWIYGKKVIVDPLVKVQNSIFTT